MIALVYFTPGEEATPRWGVRVDDMVYDLSGYQFTLTDWLRHSTGRVEGAIADLVTIAHGLPPIPFAALTDPAAGAARLLAPISADQDVWAAGVTYERSRAARQEEAQDGGDVYARVYTAERPELFFKGRGAWTVPPHEPIGVRGDSAWNVPEPELALVINPAGAIVGYTGGNDVSSRSIEGENPLYLPQAKVYRRSCTLGPQIVLTPIETHWPDVTIGLTITRGGAVIVEESVTTARIRRTPTELVTWLYRGLDFPAGAVLLTGTGIVPAAPFTLTAGDVVSVSVGDAGTLINPVVTV